MSFIYFNSIKVRLEQVEKYREHVDKLDFNSIKVRLELAYLACDFHDVPEFQFHKGAIRTNIVAP